MNQKLIFTITICFLLLSVISIKAYAEYLQKTSVAIPQPEYAKGEVILKLKVTPPKIINNPNKIVETGLPSIDRVNSRFRVNSMTKILEKHEKLAERSNKLTLFKQHGLDRIYLIKLPKDVNVFEVVEEFNRDGNVEYAEPNYIVSIDTTTSTTSTITTSVITTSSTSTIVPMIMPNDPEFSKLWGLHNTGQTGGTVDADIDAPEIWNTQTSSNNVIIAVIDTGIDYNHEDLAANMWVNPGEIPGNDIDDDSNGFIDDVHGFDFVNNDNDPLDDNGHGTHVAGTIAAVGNNGIGVVGVAWQAKIMALKFLNSAGSGTTSSAISSIQYASLMGAKITSNSWGGGSYSQALYDAISAANNAGVLFVAAAGNANRNNDIYPFYPSSYDIPNIVSVASTTNNDERSTFSNYGLSVDIAAPGSSIYSTMPNNLYGYKSGTSMATPHVSGVLGLLLSKNPTLNINDAKLTIIDSADSKVTSQPIGDRLNAYNTLFPKSKISNTGVYKIKGYLLIKSQTLTAGSWQDTGSYINDLTNNYLRTIEPSDTLNLRYLYNNLNFRPNELGHYRIFARFTDRYGNTLATYDGLLEDTFEFDVITTTSTTTTSSTTTTTVNYQYSVPDGDIENSGGWLRSNTSSLPLYVFIDEQYEIPSENDRDYIKNTGDNVAYKTYTTSLSNAIDPLTDANHYLWYRVIKPTSSPSQVLLRLRLMQGNTVIRSWTYGFSVADSRTYSIALTSAEAALITDYNDLRLEFGIFNPNNTSPSDIYISWAQLQVPSP